MQKQVYVIVLSYNSANRIGDCLGALKKQTCKHQLVVVDNASGDGSVELIQKDYPEAVLLTNSYNKGFAGGVNTGLRYAQEQGGRYAALINDDAVAEKDWLEKLVRFMEDNPKAGIAASKIIGAKDNILDSTGECYSVWGLAYPRGRGEKDAGQYDDQRWIFGASGGASIYRLKLLKQIGLFDEDFFLYYEDVDISYRAQLAGWKVGYVPEAIVHHEIGASSGQVKGLYTYHTLKNLPLLLWKNTPWRLMPKIWPRLVLAYSGFVLKALARGYFVPVLKGLAMGTVLWPKKLIERTRIQRSRKVSAQYIDSIIVHNFPPRSTS